MFFRLVIAIIELGTNALLKHISSVDVHTEKN